MNKITLVTGIYPPEIGGPASHFYGLVKYLKESNKKRDFNLITLSNKGRAQDINLYYVNRKNVKIIRLFIVSFMILKLSIKSRYIYSGGLYIECFIASLFTRKKIIYRIVGDPVWERVKNKNLTKLSIDDFQDSKNSFLIRIERHLFSYIFRRAKYIVTPSEYLKKIITGWGIDENKIKIITNGVEIINKNNSPTIEKKYDLVTVCRLVSWKGVDEIIQIAKKKNYRLAVVGNGPELDFLKSKVEINDKIKFFGNLNKLKTIDVLLSSKIFFLNSTYEGLPYSLLEAMALGLPCVATETGGSKTVITNDFDGKLVPVYGLERKIEVIDSLINDIYTQKKLIDNAKLTIEKNYSLNTMIKNIISLIYTD